MSRIWSQYQQAIFTFVKEGSGNAVVEAVAGSGKSTTIVQAMSCIEGNSIFLAFNKSIAEELKAKGVNARTFHSLTYAPVTRHKGVRQVSMDKLRNLCDANMRGNDSRVYSAFATKLVGLARGAGIGCLVPDVEQSWLDLVTYHDLEVEHEDGDLGRGMELASDLLAWSNASSEVDFDDMLYLAVKDGLVLPKFDFIFVDEAQDTNAIQRALLRKIMKPESRLVAVGDPAQAIYGFRGADGESLNLIAKEFECVRLPLTVSYRCPTKVVDYLHQWVDHIEAAPDAPEGVVSKLSKWDHTTFKADDLVVCRTTGPIIALCFRLMRKRVPARVMGREIGAGLKSLINKMRANDLDDLEEKLNVWREREVEKATAKKQESKAEQIHDKADSIIFLVNSMNEDSRTIPALLAVIDSLFADGVGKVTLSTIHKAKGMEADRVYWLNSSRCPAQWAKQPWQKQQEVNLCYVAGSRARKELYLIEDGSGGRGSNEALNKALADIAGKHGMQLADDGMPS
jgi:DNA helicase-2/ATP-dependent DNA helicase PcrA